MISGVLQSGRSEAMVGNRAASQLCDAGIVQPVIMKCEQGRKRPGGTLAFLLPFP